jgi:hypothetical protein
LARITDYTSLCQAVADYLDRPNLVQFIPNFIQNCEGTLYKSLRIRAMENALSVTVASGVAALPTSPAFVELKFAYVNASPVQPLDRVLPEQIYQLHPDRSGTTSTPTKISTEGEYFTFSPKPADGVVIKGIYYGRLDSLSVASPRTGSPTTRRSPALRCPGDASRSSQGIPHTDVAHVLSACVPSRRA